MKSKVTDYLLYRWRFRIGFLVVAFVVVGVVIFTALNMPGALREAEQQTALTSSKLSATSLDVNSIVNFPYYILQRVSFLIFGVTTMSIKLPSIILGVLTTLGIFLLAKNWFSRSIGVMVTLLATTSTQFLFIAQDGTPAITFSVVTIWLLAICTFVTRKKLFSTFWKVVCGVLMAVELYLPFGIYVDIALIITMLLHPHIRYLLRRISRPRFVLATVLGIIAMVPLGYAIYVNHTIALTLLGIPSVHTNLLDNVRTSISDLFGFLLPATSFSIRPVYSLSLLLLMILGIYRLIKIRYTARSYTTSLLLVTIVPLVIMNPSYQSALFPIAVILLALGSSHLVTSWYKLFPRNPYARIAGLIPLIVFTGGMVFADTLRYANNYTYNSTILSHYNSDLSSVDKTLAKYHARLATTQLITTKKEAEFYSLVAHYDKRFHVGGPGQSSSTLVIMTHAAYHAAPPSKTPTEIITNRFAQNADRLYVYTNK